MLPQHLGPHYILRGVTLPVLTSGLTSGISRTHRGAVGMWVSDKWSLWPDSVSPRWSSWRSSWRCGTPCSWWAVQELASRRCWGPCTRPTRSWNAALSGLTSTPKRSPMMSSLASSIQPHENGEMVRTECFCLSYLGRWEDSGEGAEEGKPSWSVWGGRRWKESKKLILAWRGASSIGVLALLGDSSTCRGDKQGRPSPLPFHDSELQVMGFPHCLIEGLTWVRQGGPPLVPKGADSLASHRGYLPVSTTPGVMGRLMQKTHLRSILGPQEDVYRMGHPRWLRGKESTCTAGGMGSILVLGRSSGKGNGSPLQYSCLESPMDRGAWPAGIHGVAKNGTRLKRLTTHASVQVYRIMQILLHFIWRLEHPWILVSTRVRGAKELVPSTVIQIVPSPCSLGADLSISFRELKIVIGVERVSCHWERAEKKIELSTSWSDLFPKAVWLPEWGHLRPPSTSQWLHQGILPVTVQLLSCVQLFATPWTI